mmetsp:Transcript_48743/g.148290  ORF Transcript_48743/g.148290 Transcript_48743/m.148290 type:complete len:289 (-) Transcript_48743:337-1203(-)
MRPILVPWRPPRAARPLHQEAAEHNAGGPRAERRHDLIRLLRGRGLVAQHDRRGDARALGSVPGVLAPAVPHHTEPVHQRVAEGERGRGSYLDVEVLLRVQSVLNQVVPIDPAIARQVEGCPPRRRRGSRGQRRQAHQRARGQHRDRRRRPVPRRRPDRGGPGRDMEPHVVGHRNAAAEGLVLTHDQRHAVIEELVCVQCRDREACAHERAHVLPHRTFARVVPLEHMLVTPTSHRCPRLLGAPSQELRQRVDQDADLQHHDHHALEPQHIDVEGRASAVSVHRDEGC